MYRTRKGAAPLLQFEMHSVGYHYFDKHYRSYEDKDFVTGTDSLSKNLENAGEAPDNGWDIWVDASRFNDRIENTGHCGTNSIIIRNSF